MGRDLLGVNNITHILDMRINDVKNITLLGLTQKVELSDMFAVIALNFLSALKKKFHPGASNLSKRVRKKAVKSDNPSSTILHSR